MISADCPSRYFFPPNKKFGQHLFSTLKPQFFFHPKVEFFSPDAFQFHPRNFPWVCACHVRFHPYCDPRSSRVPVPPAAPHGDPSNSSPIMGFRVPQKTGCTVFFFLFFSEGFGFFWGLVTKQQWQDGFDKQSAEIGRFQGCFKDKVPTRLPISFLSPEGRKWLQQPNSTIEGTKLPLHQTFALDPRFCWRLNWVIVKDLKTHPNCEYGIGITAFSMGHVWKKP